MASKLKDALAALEQIAPLRFAESWDKVGLLIDPHRRGPLRRIFLCIDLSEPVLAEAIASKAQLIVAYHPPIFEPLARLIGATPTERIVADSLRAGIAVYSPHTALDSAPGGVNDWLAEAFDFRDCRPLGSRLENPEGQDLKIVVFVPESAASELRLAMSKVGAGRIGDYELCSFGAAGQGSFRGKPGSQPHLGQAGSLESVDEIRLEMVCSGQNLSAIQDAIIRVHPYEEPAWDCYQLAPRPKAETGMGRILTLKNPATLEQLTKKAKKHLKLKKLRVAASARHLEGALIETVAVCAGAGGSVLTGVDADLLLTGEMRHHDALAAVAEGRSVLLGEHSNTERGFLPGLRDTMAKALPGVTIEVSNLDRDPFDII